MMHRLLKPLFPTVLALVFAWTAAAQAPQKQQDSHDQDQHASDGSSSSSSIASAGDQVADSKTPAYDPFHAQQDVEIGTYYMHKGDVDAAIGRFEDAIRLKAIFAKPRLLLAEAYLKKGDKPAAVKYYKEYLQVFPDAPDANKIRGKIEKLSK